MIKALKGGLRIRIEPFARALSLIPKLILFVACVSLALYIIQRLIGGSIYPPQASDSVAQSLPQMLTTIFYALLGLLGKLLSALASPAGVTATSVGALVAVLVLIASVFGWRYAIIYAVTSYAGSLVIGVLVALAASTLGLGRAPPSSLHLSGGLAGLFLFGFLGLLSLSRLIFNTLLGWVGSQLADFLFLAAVMSVLGFAAMYVDKRAAVEASQLLRLSDERKIELLERAGGEIKVVRIPEKDLARYALLGGGLGILAGAILLRHKIRDLSFLLWVAVLTLVSMYVLGAASCG